MVSIPSLHFFRWASQLEDSGHEVFWFDSTGMSAKVPRIDWMEQNAGWKLKWNYPARTFIKNKFPRLYRFIQSFNENKIEVEFEKYLQQIQPDVVHSFALYLSCTPILKVMLNYPDLKWIYSSWGSDLYYFQQQEAYLKDIKAVLPRVNYLFTDCQRDYEIAKKWGFQGEFLGVFPGGGGFDLERMQQYKLPFEKRKTILIKGFQGRSGRAIPVLQAIMELKAELQAYTIQVFGSDTATFDFLKNAPLNNWDNFVVTGKITQHAVWKLMGESLIYIGNSNSDGMPNTLLEAICMDVFPIQSNPGGATAEIIQDGVNGLLIEDCESVKEIRERIKKALVLAMLREKLNGKLVASMSFQQIKKTVLEKYNLNENI